MNETLQDLEQKREVVEKDIDFLFETLRKEITAQKKIWENKISHIFFLVFQTENTNGNDFW